MIETATYLGPATVTRTEGKRDHVWIDLPVGENTWARLALALPYQPSVGDEVLVVTNEDEKVYVIGLLRRTGKLNLKVNGDLSIEASGFLDLAASQGVRIRGDESVELEAPEMELRSGRLQVVADRILQKARDFFSWASGLFQTKAQRVRTVVESSFTLKSERTYLRSDGEVKVDGESIHLG